MIHFFFSVNFSYLGGCSVTSVCVLTNTHMVITDHVLSSADRHKDVS